MKVMKSIVGATLLLTSFSAFAETRVIKQAADWTLYETDGTTCYVSTSSYDPNVGDGGGFPGQQSMVYLSISKAKNKASSPVEMMVQISTNLNKSYGAVASVSGAGSISLSDLDGSKANLWALPKNLSSFIERMKSNSASLKVKLVGGKRSEDLTLSTRGFKDVMGEMQNYCNGGQPLVNAEFESTLLGSVADNIDPTKIDVTKTGQLRNIYYAAYSAIAGVAANKYALANILVKYQPLIDELKINREQADVIQNRNLPDQRNILAGAQKQQVDAAADISRINGQIPGLTSKIAASQKAYDAARAILAPLEPEFNRLTGNLSEAQSTLSDSQNRLSYIDTRLRDGAQTISRLESEARDIEYRLPQKRSDLDRARSLWRDAESRRANFNVSWERDTRLRNNFEYSRLINDRQNTQNQYRQVEQEVQRARMERDRWARELQQCRAQPLIEVGSGGAGPISRGDNPIARPGRPGFPGGPGGPGVGPRPPGPGGPGDNPIARPPNPGGPTTPPPQPPRDCSRFEQGYNNANMQVSQRENDLRNLANRFNDINNRISYVERQVDMEVRRDYDNLVSMESQARREFDRRESDVNTDQNRLSQIRSADIPRLEREQTQLQNERPSVLSRISQATSDVARLQQELDSFKAANDWNRKFANVSSTGNQLAADEAALRLAQSNKAEAEQRLAAGAATEAQAKAEISSLNARLAALNNRAAELNAGLAKLPEERKELDAAIAAGEVEYAARKAEFQNLLK